MAAFGFDLGSNIFIDLKVLIWFVWALLMKISSLEFPTFFLFNIIHLLSDVIFYNKVKATSSEYSVYFFFKEWFKFDIKCFSETSSTK